MDGVITCLLQGVGKIPIILDGLVELHVANVRVALVHPRYEGGPGWSANGSGTIMPVHDRAGHGHLIQFRSFNLNPFALLLKQNAEVAVAQVVG